jgi:hypothetical protein
MPQPVSLILTHTHPFAAPVAMVITPRFRIAWAAFTSRFMNTWFNCDAMHLMSGSLPYCFSTVA